MKPMNLGIKSDKENDLYNKIRNNLDNVKSDFEALKREGLVNYNYYSGNPWTEKEKLSHLQQGRQPKVMNEIFPKIQHLLGAQMQTRMDIKAVGREVSDEMSASIISYLIKWVEQTNNLKNTESQVFLTGALTGVAFAYIYWDNNEILQGYPKVEYVPFGEISWDIQHTNLPDLSDSPWMCRTFYDSRENLAIMFPDYSDWILNKATIEEEEIMTGEGFKYAPSGYKYYDKAKELLRCYDYNEKHKVPVYVVIDDVRGELNKFETETEAKEYMNTLIDGYVSQGMIMEVGDSYGSELVFMEKYVTNVVHQTIVISDRIVADNDLSIGEYQYVPYFPYYWEGNFFGVVDNLRSPQDEINRSYSQWDHALGAQNKGVTLVVEGLLKKGWSYEKVARELSKTRPIIPAMSPNAITTLPDNPVNPQIFNTIQFAQQIMISQLGGSNAFGLTENAAESGKAVEVRAQVAGTGRLPIFDSLRQWRLNISERIVWYIQNCMSPRQIIRLIGNSPELKYVDINNGVLDSLQEIKVDIIVDEAMQSQTMKERYFAELLHFFQVVPMSPDLVLPLLLEYTTIPETKKEEIRKYYEIHQQAVQEELQAAKEEKMKEQVMTQIQKQQLRDKLKETIGISANNQEQGVAQQLLAQQEIAQNNTQNNEM